MYCIHNYFSVKGCYNDKEDDRALPTNAGFGVDQTIPKCINICQNKQYMTYAGLEVIVTVYHTI